MFQWGTFRLSNTAEALIRFLGPLFLNRVSLIVIDEAHFVQFNGSTYEDLRNGANRSLRLEMLVNRLLRYVNDKRIIALSAVAKKNESLAHWVTGNESSKPVVTNYRSTRQLIGRLEWSHTGEFEIHYDILNGSYLGFDDEGDGGVPYIPKPFTPFPVPYQQLHSKYIGGENKVGKRQRPYLFWAAMQLAQPDEQGNQHSVLISVNQKVGGYAEDFLYVVNNTLAEDSLPQFFERPTDSTNQELFDKCLDACADYFGTDSYEYQLLEKGVVVHHGSMPGILARLLVELLQKGIVHIALATSTLSEGINLPFETVIVPTLIRDQDTLPITEFMNLAGRAGRPGWGTEGRTLVLLQTATRERSSQKAWRIYNRVLQDITGNRQSEQNATVQSPLGALMSHMERAWSQVTGSHSGDEFFEWLERTVPLEDPATGAELAAEEALDALDGHLLSVLVEQESMTGETMNRSDLEDYLIDVWRKTYARYVVSDAEHWEEVFAVRGQALQERIYPDSGFRRRLYRTSVAPRYGKRILEGYQVIRDHLVTGANYSEWSTEERLQFIIQTVEQISNLGNTFQIPGGHGRGKNAPSWYEIMTWWMNPRGASKRPKKNQVSEWVKFVKRQFEYKFNWGLGTVLALILDDVNAGALQETSIEDWPKTGLPWVVFWLKELITWGTLDPVAAMLLTYSVEFTRSNAETRAQDYYETTNGLDADEVLNAKRIKEWVDRITRDNAALPTEPTPKGIKVSLSRDFSKAKVQEWRVVPITKEGSITWIDPAGYELATCEIPAWWRDRMDATHDFVLNVKSKTIKVSRYL
ncbi:hypothetical protein [Alicyclobacillus suci]|uniref:hypothetical protein n=1 Tax=Alicyclobacillus suci TaxID=2816080 RepID=UPI001A8F4802|nr:hypothetical protein [Alicyclobacillus suci]